MNSETSTTTKSSMTTEISTTNDGNQNYVEVIFYRFPKSNQESMLKIIDKSLDLFKREGIQYNYYRLSNIEQVPRFTNITKVMKVSDSDEEIWMDLLTYNNKQHRDVFVLKMSNDKNCQEGYEEFTKLLTPGSGVINGEFNKI